MFAFDTIWHFDLFSLRLSSIEHYSVYVALFPGKYYGKKFEQCFTDLSEFCCFNVQKCPIY